MYFVQCLLRHHHNVKKSSGDLLAYKSSTRRTCVELLESFSWKTAEVQRENISGMLLRKLVARGKWHTRCWLKDSPSLLLDLKLSISLSLIHFPSDSLVLDE